MAGYSSTPTAAKLGIGPLSRVILVGAPGGWAVPELPPDVRPSRRRAGTRLPAGVADVTIAFFRNATSLRRELPGLGPSVYPAGGLWAAWPRRAGGHVSDITDGVIREVALPLGLVDTKVAAIDDDWSGLRLVWRKELRAGAGPPPVPAVDHGEPD
jgi:hypothetical protein